MGVYTGIAQDNVTITSGTATFNSLTVSGVTQFNGALESTAPVVKTADFTVADTETFLVNNKSGSACTVTLPAAASWTGRILVIKTIQAQAVNSASSNVVPANSNTAGTAIVTNTAGNWALLVSDGTNWVIMAS
jgi:hypothetical protein